jgi:hemoglobin/transferrin/lactoferrin receptor protein
VLFVSRSMTIKTLLLLTLTLLISGNAYTQDSLDYADTIHLDAVVVVGRRVEAALNDRPEAISVMNMRQLKSLSPMNMPDAMSAMPGVFMQKTNQGGGSPFVRGLTGYHTLILVDGVRLNNAIFRSGPNQYLNTVDPLMIRQIEVLRGPGSVQYGTEAIGGTILLRSKNPQFSEDGFKLNSEVYGKWMSNNMEKTGRAQLHLSTRKFAVIAGFTRKDFGNIVAGGELGKLDYTSYDEYSADVKAGVKLSPHQTLSLAWQHHKQNEVQLYHKLIRGDYSTYEFDPQKRDLIYLRHEITRNNSIFSGFRSTLSMHQSDETRKKQRTGSEDLYTEHDLVRSYGFILECLTNNDGNWTGVTGYEIYYDRVSSSTVKTDLVSGTDSTFRGLYPNNSWISNMSLFTLHTLSLGSLELNGGLRYNHFVLGLTDDLFGDLTIKPDALVGSLGASYRVFRNTDISLSIHNAFRAPNINDVSSFGIADFRYEVPNFDLSPEKSLNKELGIKTSQRRISGSVYLYHNSLTDLMTNVRTTFQGQDSIDDVKVYTRENVGSAYIRGIEGELQLRPLRYLSINSYLIYTYGQNVTRNEPLRRIPPLNGRLGVNFHHVKNLEILTEWQFAAKQDRLSSGDIDDSRIPEGGTPAWNVFNLRFSYRINGLTANTGLLNLFNEAYRTHGSGVECTGRSVYVSLLFNFTYNKNRS